jgi:hypothetical protein
MLTHAAGRSVAVPVRFGGDGSPEHGLLLRFGPLEPDGSVQGHLLADVCGTRVAVRGAVLWDPLLERFTWGDRDGVDLQPLRDGARHGRGGGQGADAPVGHRGRELRQRGVVEAAAAADEQAQHLRVLGRELQPARRHQVEPAPGLADDAGHLGMAAERLLHR